MNDFIKSNIAYGPALFFPYNQTFSAEYYDHSLTVLETALNRVPAYELWRAFDSGRKYPIDVRYAPMPSLTKKDIREHFPQGFVPNNLDVNQGLASREIDFVKTSGSTGDSVTNIWNQRWWDASEKASWKLNSYATKVATGNHREAILANPLNVGFISNDVELSMEKRRLSRFLYLNEQTNPLSWTQKYMDRMIHELDVFRPVILEANPSYLARLCRYITTNKKGVFQPELIVFTYEYPTTFHYRQIRQVFDVPIMSSYGATEVGYVFIECEIGQFHQNSEFCRVDFQPLKPSHGGPALGRILVTTFNNPWYIIVRFDVGDLVHLSSESSCSCQKGSGLILDSVEGRVSTVTLTCRGRLVTVHELDKALGVLEGIDEYRLEQETQDIYHLHLVSQREDRSKLQKDCVKVLRALYGEESKILIDFDAALSPSVSGKYSVSQALFPINIEDYLDERYISKRNIQ